MSARVRNVIFRGNEAVVAIRQVEEASFDEEGKWVAFFDTDAGVEQARFNALRGDRRDREGIEMSYCSAWHGRGTADRISADRYDIDVPRLLAVLSPGAVVQDRNNIPPMDSLQEFRVQIGGRRVPPINMESKSGRLSRACLYLPLLTAYQALARSHRHTRVWQFIDRACYCSSSITRSRRLRKMRDF